MRCNFKFYFKHLGASKKMRKSSKKNAEILDKRVCRMVHLHCHPEDIITQTHNSKLKKLWLDQ